ncbi:MAG: ATP-dependent DNA ligase, partial [Rhizobiales bacterium]|nr:ATP-dependent DNA ligase [Hyphomicrobiales bacterium]
MALERYRQKRRFDVTAEPRGTKAHRGGDAFVIQKHAATRLHYDLRLELDGVMKSWAVTKGPSLVPGEKRLAVHVEDHPVAYNTFEGTIPKGEYGGGTVMIWDRGRWIPQSDAARGYAKGHLEFTLEGEKLHGRWHLVRMHKREGERQDPWLLIKSDDAAARSADDPDILDEADRSVASGRSMEEIAAGKPVRKRSARGTVPAVAVWSSNRSALVKGDVAAAASTTPARRPARKGSSTRLPDFVPPCLAQASDTAPDGAGWLHEVKLDGYRMQAHIADGAVRLLTRTGLDWTGKFRSVATALAKLRVDTAIIDGEIVVETA